MQSDTFQPFKFDKDFNLPDADDEKIIVDSAELANEEKQQAIIQSLNSSDSAETNKEKQEKEEKEKFDQLTKAIREEAEKELELKYEAKYQEKLAQAEETSYTKGNQEGFQKGFDEGERKAKEKFEDENAKKGLKILQKIEEKTAALLLTGEEWFSRRDGEIADFVSSLMKKIVPVYTKNHGSDEIVSFVKQVISLVASKTQLEIRLPHSAAHLAPILRDMLVKSGAGFNSNDRDFSIKSDKNLDEGDCIIQWTGGSIERQSNKFWQEVDKVLKGIEDSNSQNGDTDAGISQKTSLAS